jgi:hypothetical protein
MNDGEEVSEKIGERGAKEVCGRGQSECTTRSGSAGCTGLERSRRGRFSILDGELAGLVNERLKKNPWQKIYFGADSDV